MRTISYTQALREALIQEMARDPSVFLLGEDIGKYGGAFGVTRGLLDKFGSDRVINTPISEQSFVGAAVGAALMGSRPVAEIMFMDFITLAIDPLVNQAAKLHYVLGKQASCPLVVRTAAGAGRRYGPTHSQMFTACFTSTPGLKVAAPSTPADAAGLLKTAIRDNNPVVFIEHKRLYNSKGPVPAKQAPIPFGKARLARKGTNLTIVSWSWMATEAERAADELAGMGITADVIDLRTLNPLDTCTVVESVKRTGRLLIIEEGASFGGVGAEVGLRVFEQAHDYLDAPVIRVASPEVPIPASPLLEDAWVPDRQAIVNAAKKLVRAP